MQFISRSILILLLTQLSSCSWFGWGADECLDKGNCETAAATVEPVSGRIWYCYGKSRNEPWDCSNAEDPSKVQVVSIEESEEEPANQPNTIRRAEIKLDEELHSIKNSDLDNSQITTTSEPSAEETSPPATISTSEMPNVSKDLLESPDEYFAIQLIALQTEVEATRFIENHNIQVPRYAKIQSQGEDWFVIILDIYSSRDAAEAAASEWVEKHQPMSTPWVRPVGPLKKAVLSASTVGA